MSDPSDQSNREIVMQAAKWQALIAQFAELTQHQRLQSMELLRGASPGQAATALIESTARARLCCPACRSQHLHRHGHANDLQRYRCVPCGKTFNALTGTPLAHLRHKSLWLDYADCLLNSNSVRKAAQQLGIHRNTSFRWRHRFLALAKTDRPRCLHGITEADEMYLLESRKARGICSARRAGVVVMPGNAAFPASRCAYWWRATARGKPSLASRARDN